MKLIRLLYLTAGMVTSSAMAEPATCASVAFEIQTSVGAQLINQGRNTIRLAHPAVREIQVTCLQGLASPVDHVWVSAFGTTPDRRFDDMLDVLWRISGGKKYIRLPQEARDCLGQATAAFGPPDYFSSANSNGGNVDCSYGTIIDKADLGKITYAVTLKIRPDRIR